MLDESIRKDVDISQLDKKVIKENEEAPLSLGSWLDLNLTADNLQIIVDNMLDEIDIIDTDRKPLYGKIKEYRNQYDLTVEDTSTPFPSCFNLCVPITPKNVDACVAQTEEAFEDVDPKWAIQTPPDKKLVNARDMQEKTLDYYSDSEMEDAEAWTKTYHDAFLLGTGWICMVFKRSFEKVRDFVEYDNLETFQKDFPDDWQKYPKYIEKLAIGEKINMVLEYNQEIIRSPKPEHAKWEDIYVPIATEGLAGMLKARIVARYVPMRWEEIFMQEKQGDYIAGVAEKLKYKMGKEGLSEDLDPDFLKKVYDTYEVMYFVDIDNDNIEERCLFNIEKEHKLGLRAIRYPYNHNRPYVIPYYIQDTHSGIYQPGLGQKLSDINIALNAILNHTLNASVIANSLSLKVRQGSDALKALFEHRWYPGSILELMNVDDVQQFTFNTPNLSSLINLFAVVERFGEDVSGIVNYMIGKESPDDPDAPASKTFALMKKAELKLRRYIKCLKRSNNEAGYQALRLIYQYIPKSRIAEILGIEENKVAPLFQYPLKTITQASGFALEKMFEKRDNMQMLGMLMKDPEIFGNIRKRMTLYRIVGETFGSDWDKKLERVLPSDDKLKQREEAAKRKMQDKRAEIIRRTSAEVLKKGGTPKQAKEMAMRAANRFEEMASQPPQPEKGAKNVPGPQPNTRQPA